jgi:hypothetical protein
MWIPIPNTSYRLPLTWDHTRAIEKLAKFFAGLYYRTERSDEKVGLDKYKNWMITLIQMQSSIYEGKYLEMGLLTGRVGSTK